MTRFRISPIAVGPVQLNSVAIYLRKKNKIGTIHTMEYELKNALFFRIHDHTVN